MKKMVSLLGLALLLLMHPLAGAVEDYTIDDLLRLADARSPRIASARSAVDEAIGRRRQAGLYPNPFLEVMQDDVPSDSGDVSDGKTTVALGQPLIIGGRRRNELRASQSGIQAAVWEYEATRHTVFREVHALWFELIYLSEAMEIEYALFSIAEAIEADATRDSDRKRARLEAETILAGVLGLITRQATARERLEELLGGERLDAGRLQGDLEVALDPTEVARLQSQSIAEHPRLLAMDARVEESVGELATARSSVAPDVTVSVLGGYAGRDDEGFVGAGVMIPIPLLNRLQGRRAEAEARVARLQADRDGTAVSLQADLRVILQLLNELDTLVETYRTRVVPMAQESHAATMHDFRAGDVGVTEALDTMRRLADSRRMELKYRLDLSNTLSDFRHFVRFGPESTLLWDHSEREATTSVP